MAVVLTISSDDRLAMTRRMILEKAGHRVVSAFSTDEVEQACSAEEFDVAVIGQGIPSRERLRIRDLVRQRCPGAKLLELHLPAIGAVLADADAWMEVPSGAPTDLADRVTALAVKQR